MDGSLNRLFQECKLDVYIPRQVVGRDELSRLGNAEEILHRISSEKQRGQAYYGE